MLRAILAVVVLFAANLLSAQAKVTLSNYEIVSFQAPIGASDSAKVAAAIRGSYYHPDDMSDLACRVYVDWPAFFVAMKIDPPAERLKKIQDLVIRLDSVRGKRPNISFEWTSGALANKEQFEEGLKQMLSGFDQMYWSMIASPPLDNAAEISKIEPILDGAKVYSSTQNTNLIITLNNESTPTHYVLDSPAMKGTIDIRYLPAPKPIPGDLRRISGMNVSEQIGTTTMNIKLDLDYQAVDGFFVPGHVSYDIGGALSISMVFSGCSASKGAQLTQ